MPSDAKKKQQQKKKEAAKARQSGKKLPSQSNNLSKTTENGKEQSPTSGDLPNGICDPSVSTEGRLKEKAYLLTQYACEEL